MEKMTEQIKTGAKSRYHHGDLRAALVEATRQLVEEKGPDHFSVSQAARAAGVSTAAPYRHFRDKDELLAAVCLDGMQRHYAAMEEAVADLSERSLERVRRLGQVYVAFARSEPGVFRLVFGSRHQPEALEEIKAEEEVDTFGFVVREVAIVLGLAPDDPEARRRAFVLWTFVHGLSFLLIDDKVQYAGIPVDVDAILDDVCTRVMTEPARRPGPASA
jgi:AcrR family transcriptional regulator